MRILRLAGLVVALAMSCAPATASAAFGLLPGLEGFAVSASRNGLPADQAGSHPDQVRIHLGLKTAGSYTDGDLRDLRLQLPAGMLANPAALDECSQAEFFTPRQSPYEESLSGESCPDTSQVGVVAVQLGGGITRHFGVFSVTAPYGAAEAIGFAPFGMPAMLIGHLSPADAQLTFDLRNLSQAVDVQSLDITLWGTPWEWKYDTQRGNCLNEVDPLDYHGEASRFEGTPSIFYPGTCYIPTSKFFTKTYLTLPTVCERPMEWTAAVRGWGEEEFLEATAFPSDEEGEPVLLQDCLEVLTRPSTKLRTDQAASATGLVYDLEVIDGGGLLNVNGAVRSPIEKALVRLPEGLTVNPSLGAGLGVCTEAQFALENATNAPGSGCPNSSKIGEVAADGLLGLPDLMTGSVFLAEPYENSSHSLIGLYITLASPRRGLFFKSSGRVEPDPATGRLTISFDDLPPLHYDRFTLSLREGERAPMVSPPACGAYVANLESTPYSDPGLVLHESSTIHITRGEGGGECPSGGAPFHPALQAGSVNPNAAAYTPFKLRMTRTDAEQEITSYSASFPPGLLGKIAGIPYCPDSAIDRARGRTGREELADPSCPVASQVGQTLAGYGVGSTLAYAPGSLYLSGPYGGAPLSIVAIDSALVGPFDLGVVVVRSAIRVDPRTAQVSIDSSGSDPIPHIIKGLPLHLRDIRVEVDRPGFMVNPTNCDPMATLSHLTGSGHDFYSPADDVAATTPDRYQLSDCSGFGLRPQLSMKLTGGTTRSRYPSLRSTYVPRPGDANLKKITVSLPPSLFLAQEHITEICTIPRFAARRCPAGSRLGFARATTPLLDEPLQGPVYLRANSAHTLPDVVADLSSARGIQIEVVGRITKARNGGLRVSFEDLPDAPVSRFSMVLLGGRRGLLVNAANLCASRQHATARLIAHNNATRSMQPRIGVACGKGAKRNRGGRR